MSDVPEGCTVKLLGGTCPTRNLCPVHNCTEDRCYCEEEPDE
jgi:hypothetical protein